VNTEDRRSHDENEEEEGKYSSKNKAVERNNFKNQLLSHEHWRGQLYGAGIGQDLVHMRHMRPRCAHVPGWLSTKYLMLQALTNLGIEDRTDHSSSSNIAIFVSFFFCSPNSITYNNNIGTLAPISTLGN
jgi:hypothetical protein